MKEKKIKFIRIETVAARATENSLKLNETSALHARQMAFSIRSQFFRHRCCCCCCRWCCCWRFINVLICRCAIRRSPYVFCENLLFAFPRFSGSFFPLLSFCCCFFFFVRLFAHHCRRSQFIKICCFWLGTYRYFYLATNTYCCSLQPLEFQTTALLYTCPKWNKRLSILTFSRL